MLDSQQVAYLAQEVSIAFEQGLKLGAETQPTLRDRFAMAALQGDIASEHEGWAITDKADGPTREQQLAERAYRMADAMLEARKPTAVDP